MGHGQATAIRHYVGNDLQAVTVLFCGDSAAQVGAVELWHAARHDPQMKLVDGYFGRAEKFEFISRHTQFSRKNGLPGRVWDSGLPLIMDDLGHGEQFLRQNDAVKIGINRAVVFPCSARGGGAWVLAFPFSHNSPIVRRFELWTPDLFCYRSGYCESNTPGGLAQL